MASSETAAHPGEGAAVRWLSDVTLRSDAPLSEQIYTHLRDAVVTGRIAPGRALHEPSLAQQFGASRTPVREALLRLRDDGLVDIKRQSGTFVAPVDHNRVEEGMIVREALEPRMAAIAAEKMTDRVLADLAFETDQMAKAALAGDSRSFIAADDRFHRALVDASGFLHIAEIIRRVNAQLDRIRYLSASEPIRSRTAIEEHQALISSLRAKNAASSAEKLRQHLSGSWVLIRKLLREQDARPETGAATGTNPCPNPDPSQCTGPRPVR